jgi:hypothetical protein
VWRVVVLSPGRPVEALAAFHLRPPRGFPRGVYASDEAIGLWIVVAAELPETRETLALRVLGRGETQRRAVAELLALPREAWEHRLLAVLVQWRREIVLDGIRSDDDEDFMQTTKFSLEAYEQHLRDEGIAQGIAQGRSQGIALGTSQGIAQGARSVGRMIERRLGRTLSDAERDHLATRILREGPERVADLVLDLPPEALDAWVAATPTD